MQILLPRDVQFILETIRQHGHEAFAVGGCVRDSLLMHSPTDYDIATSMKPTEVKKIFKRTFDTGIEHGTVTVVLNRVNYEVTTYRLDGIYTDSRRPESVTFTTSIQDDLSRRDFTINAMAYSDRDGLIDFYGGLDDLRSKTIRAVGDPATRFTEDALRMLRAVRFAAQLGFSIEEETYGAITRLKDRLSYISAERIREELVKLLLSPHPQTGMLLADTGMMRYVLRGRESNTPDETLQAALEAAAVCPVNTAMRVALFVSSVHFKENDGPSRLLRDLRFDNNTIKEASAYVKHLRVAISPERVGIKKIMALMSVSWFFNILTLQKITGADEAAALTENIARDILEKGECVTLSDLKINGSDLIDAGVPAGKAVGEMLAHLLNEAHLHPEINKRETLLAMVKA